MKDLFNFFFAQLCCIYVFASECVIENQITYSGHNIKIGGKGKAGGSIVENQEACAKLCFSTDRAKFWTFLPADKLCWVKTSNKGRKSNPKTVSGNRECGQAGKLIFDEAKNIQPLIKLLPFSWFFLKHRIECSFSFTQPTSSKFD